MRAETVADDFWVGSFRAVALMPLKVSEEWRMSKLVGRLKAVINGPLRLNEPHRRL